MTKIDTSWTTERELDFIAGLGNGIYSQSNAVKLMGRKKLLKWYLEAAKRRENWGAVDKKVIIGAVRNLLNGYM